MNCNICSPPLLCGIKASCPALQTKRGLSENSPHHFSRVTPLMVGAVPLNITQGGVILLLNCLLALLIVGFVLLRLHVSRHMIFALPLVGPVAQRVEAGRVLLRLDLLLILALKCAVLHSISALKGVPLILTPARVIQSAAQ